MDTKITRLRNLMTPVKNYIAIVNADKRGESISNLLLDKELERINKNSNEIWDIISKIPDNACDNFKNNHTKFIKNKLIKDAYDLGFESYFGHMINVHEDCYLLWLEDFKTYFREKYLIHINITSSSLESFTLSITSHESTKSNLSYGDMKFEDFEDYQKALEFGLKKCIKIIS